MNQRDRDREAVLHGISIDPDDATACLAWADWLEEQGEDRRAGFVRRQAKRDDDAILMADVDRPSLMTPPYDPARFTRDAAVRWRFTPDGTTYAARSLAQGDTAVLKAILPPAAPCKQYEGALPDRQHKAVFRRGVLACLDGPWDWWKAHGPALVRREPVKAVFLSDGKLRIRNHGPQSSMPWSVSYDYPFWWCVAQHLSRVAGNAKDLYSGELLALYESEAEALADRSEALLAWARGDAAGPVADIDGKAQLAARLRAVEAAAAAALAARRA